MYSLDRFVVLCVEMGEFCIAFLVVGITSSPRTTQPKISTKTAKQRSKHHGYSTYPPSSAAAPETKVSYGLMKGKQWSLSHENIHSPKNQIELRNASLRCFRQWFWWVCQGNLRDTLMGTHYLHVSGIITHIGGLKPSFFLGFLGFLGDL